MAVIPISGVGQTGLVFDVPDVITEPTAWGNGRNIRFDNGSVYKMEGHQPLFTETGDFSLVQYWPRPLAPFYIYGTQAELFRTDSSGNTASIGSGFSTSTAAKWQSSLFNGGYTTIVNNTVDIPRYITFGNDGSVDETSLQTLPGWPTELRAHVVRPAGFALMAANLTRTDAMTGVVTDQPGTILISSEAAPGGIPASWTIGQALLTTADAFELASGAPIVEIVQLKGYVLVFTTNSIHRIILPTERQPTQAQTLNEGHGALATDCAVELNGSVFAVDRSDIYTTNGSGNIISVSNHKTRDYFQTNLNQTHFENTHIVKNLAHDEVWVCFPNLTSTGPCNEALIWNYVNDTWTIRDLPNTLSATQGPRRVGNTFTEGSEHVVVASNGFLFSTDEGYTFNGAPYESYVERTNLLLGDIQDSQWSGHVYPLMQGAGNIQFQIQATNAVGSPPTFTSVDKITYTIPTGYKIDPRSNGRFFNIRISESGQTPWTLSGYSINENTSEMR